MILVIVIGLILRFRYALTSYLVSVEDNSISYQKKIGDKFWSSEAVTSVIDYACEYQLNSDNKKISLSKKQIPNELDLHLQSKYLENWTVKMQNKSHSS